MLVAREVWATGRKLIGTEATEQEWLGAVGLSEETLVAGAFSKDARGRNSGTA